MEVNCKANFKMEIEWRHEISSFSYIFLANEAHKTSPLAHTYLFVRRNIKQITQ